MKTAILILLSTICTPALADQWVLMPDGGHCYSLPNSYPYMRMNQISILWSESHRGA